MNYKAVIEGLLFLVGEDGISIKKLAEILEISEEEVKQNLMELKKDYESESRGLKIVFLGNNFKLVTKSEHKKYYEKFASSHGKYILSNASLETLAIIAYKEPITRSEVEAIRGVNSDGIIRKLLALDFIKEAGKKDTIGKPVMFKTTNEFLDYFGLATKDDLPKIEK